MRRLLMRTARPTANRSSAPFLSMVSMGESVETLADFEKTRKRMRYLFEAGIGTATTNLNRGLLLLERGKLRYCRVANFLFGA